MNLIRLWGKMELQITRNQLFKKQVFCDYIHTKKLKKVEIFLNKG